VAFRATDQAGPFRVVNPNFNNVTWRVGEYANVTWEVANTDKAPVNCTKVNIRLSLDGGKTYPIMLAEGVNNDGSQYVLVPANLSLACRVRVDAAENVFFDISNSNFRILNPASPGLSLGLSTDAARVCQPGSFSTQILTAGTLGFSTPVALSVQQSSLPAGATVSLDKTTVNPGDQAKLSVDMSQVAQSGVYTLQVKAVAIGTTDTLLRPITITYFTNNFSAFGLKTPADGTTGAALAQTVRWATAPDALLYDVQLSTTPSFAAGTIIASKSDVAVDTFKIPILLDKSKAYYWRVRPKNECGTHAWTEAFFFSTFVESCSSFGANDLPKFISASGTPTVESVITLNAGGTIKSLNVKQLKGSHTFFKDLDIRLISPKGTEVTLLKNRCGGLSVSFDFKMDDNALSPFACPPGNSGLTYKPEVPLSAFSGENSTGPWTLRVKDTQSSSGGSIDAFQLEFCASVTLNPPFLVNNNPLTLPAGADATVTAELLRVDDSDNTHAQLTFTLVSVPKNGQLRLNGNALAPGAQFTQADIDAGALRYFDAGGSSLEDGFRFVATDNAGGFVATPKFRILPTVSAHEPGRAALAFGLFPNPADESVWVTFEAPAESDARIRVFNAAGQIVHSATLPQGSERLLLQLASLPQGLYMVQAESEVGAGVKKLMLR
jgi:subtilisin-like proprotein convertase family protein